MSLIDEAWARLSRVESFFADGWGDDAVASGAMRAFEQRRAKPPRLDSRRVGGDLAWESPVAAFLPPASRTARARVLEPKRARGTVVVLASTGDEGYARRTRWTRPLVDEGVRVVLLENPFYGRRRPAEQRRCEVRTVSDLVAMGWATVEEACQLAASYAAEGRVALAGYSMGGQMAALAAGRSAMDVACVAAAAPVSARTVFVDGVLSRVTAWSALGHDRERLIRVLDGPTILGVDPPRGGSVVIGATRDRYVPPWTVARLAHHFGVGVTWVGGGHVTGFVLGGPVLRRAVLEVLG